MATATASLKTNLPTRSIRLEPEQVQRGQIVTVEGASVSEAEVVIIDAERLVVLARAPVDDQGGFEVSVPQRPSYWLGVSGPYMTTYMDTAFAFTGEAITVGEAPAYPMDKLAESGDVDQGQTVDEVPRSHPAGKPVENGASPLLGDVDEDQTVDGDDALALFSYLMNGTVPPGGNIQLGDVNADGQIDWTDLALLGGFLTAEQDGTNPLGIGEPVPPTSLPPAPEGSVVSDRAALEAFYDATRTNRNNPRGLLSEGNWKSEAPLDEWVYVQANADGRVISLRISPSKAGWDSSIYVHISTLSGQNYQESRFSGTELVPELGQLTYLEELILNSLSLNGSLPPESENGSTDQPENARPR